MKRKAKRLLADVFEVSKIIERRGDLQSLLQDLTELVAEHIGASVCSIFLFDQESRDLVLQATDGLSPEAVGVLRVSYGEGITGNVIKNLKPIVADHATEHPLFKKVPGIGEEHYASIMAVPIRQGKTRIGVIIVHHTEANHFSPQDLTMLKAISSQLTSIILSTGMLMSLRGTAQPNETFETPVYGEGASAGIVFGTSRILQRENPLQHKSSHQTEAEIDNDGAVGLGYGLKEFDAAVEKTILQLTDIEKQLAENLSDVAGMIFTAHYLMLKDPNFTGVMRELIQEGLSAEKAIQKVSNEYAELLSAIDDPLIQEKEQDVRDLEHRLLATLEGKELQETDLSGSILLAQSVYPSELVRLWVQKAKGLVLIGQGLTAHISILSRSLGFPLLLAGDRRILTIPHNTPLILDATQGILHIDPDEMLTETYKASIEMQSSEPAEVIPDTSYTLDAVKVAVYANVNILHDAELAFERKAEGIGLYRSEFPFLILNDIPSEEDQYHIYKKVIDLAKKRGVVLRTLDVGGDKLPGAFSTQREANPFLGFRGIRYSLSSPELFQEQLRAMLRAGATYGVRILLPMISSVDEFLAGKEAVLACVEDLVQQGVNCCKRPLIGAMIETPAAVEVAGALAEHADFLSIGTNDLIMYLLAVDRSNERCGYMHTPIHPAVFSTLKRLITSVAGKESDKPGFLSICGDAAGDPVMVKFLIGIGLRSFSVEPSRIAKLKQIIGETTVSDCEAFAAAIMKLQTLKDVENFLG